MPRPKPGLGAETIGGGRVSDFGPGVYPLRLDGGPVNRYLAGTCTFTPVPEPPTYALPAGGPELVWLVRRRRSQRLDWA